jgi:hypothetical protein
MKLTYLEAEVPLTKTFSLENGEIKKIGHPKMIDCTSHHYEVPDLAAFYERTQHHAALGHCLLKGNSARELKMESRAGTTDANAPTEWVCLDLDGLKHIHTVDEFMDQVGLSDVSYIVQYSSSMGVLPAKGLSAHIFVLLDRPWLPDALKQWLKHKNFAVPGLRSGLGLTRTGNALRWTLDVTTCQNDKLIYIAPPLLEGGVKDSFEGERIRLVAKKHERATLTDAINTEGNRLSEQRALDGLREANGLEKKKWDRSKTTHGVTYMPKPDASTLTGLKEERGFVYLNLNNGDSWGYYHPKDNPEFIKNFKGEPIYRTAELLPEYWQNLQREKRLERRADDRMYLVFRNFEDSTYYNGTYDPTTEELRLAAAKGEQQVRDWLTEHGQPQPEVLETWDMVYAPTSLERVDVAKKWVNTYQPSELERRYRKAPEVVAEIPATWARVFRHALGSDEECFEHFVNWVACTLQFKQRTETAWVMHGVEGTGKGLIFNELLHPALGSSAFGTRMGAFEGQFNGFLDGKVLVFVDESQMDAHQTAQVLEGDFRNYITEPFTSIRHMRQTAREVPSHLNFVIASNKGAVVLNDTDRRYNVAPYQREKLKITPEEVQELRDTQWQCYCYLMGLKADPNRARRALDNAAKRSLAAMSRNSVEEACKALVEGDLEFFRGYVATGTTGLSSKEQDLALDYKKLVEEMPQYEKLSRDELFVLLSWVIGGLSPAPAKFTKLLSHNRITLTKVRRDGKQFRGMEVKWKGGES